MNKKFSDAEARRFTGKEVTLCPIIITITRWMSPMPHPP